MAPLVSLAPLSSQYHIHALQQLYRATPGYWQMYNLPGSPADQAARDLQAAAETPGRFMLGIVRRIVADDPQAGVELVGLIDFRLHWPEERMAYIGMVMVAEPYQRQGIGSQAWRLLRPWLAESAGVVRVRLAVEQFNHKALRFFESLGFRLTGNTRRISVGNKWILLLYMEMEIESPHAHNRS
jgi:hypothetical protein